MFPILTPSIPTTSLPNPAAGADGGGEGQIVGETAAGSDQSGSGRSTESKSFSAVLFALASIGSPLHAATPPAAPDAAARSAFFEGALAVDHEVLAGALGLEGGGIDEGMFATLEGAHGVARPLGKDGVAGDEWMAFKVFDGEVVFGGAVDVGVLEGMGALRPFEGAAHADMPTAFAEPAVPAALADGSLPAPLGDAVAKSWDVKAVDDALDVLAATSVDAAPFQVAVQVGPPPGAQEVQESPPLDPSMLHRLSGEFVTRLERVADRMFTEYGLEIDVVEGYRSQNRQEALFAQGRSAPGNVVTWTTNSLHTIGAAADVFVDGAPVTPEQAAILARVASEEGLRTLYPYDSGHIQLDRGSRSGLDGPEGPLDRQPAGSRGGGAATQPPGVAQPAPVARVARPARPGGMAFGLAPVQPGPGKPDHAPDANSVAHQPLEKGEPSTTPLGPPSLPSAEGSGSSTNTAAAPMPSASLPEPASGQTAARASPLSPTTPIDPSAFDALAGGSEYRRLHLPIEGVSGSASLDIGVRPGSVDALLNVSDPKLAEELRRSLHELRQVLTDRGIEARGLGVRLVADGGGEPMQAALDGVSRGSSSEGSSGQSTAHGERERNARYRDSAEEQDLPRQPRREHSDKEDS